jgi:hypothetical protein
MGATAGRLWWTGAGGLLILGGAAAALHLPAGDTFAEVATGKLILARGLDARSAFMAGMSTSLDLRSWLLDLGMARLDQAGGAALLEAVGAIAGAVMGGLAFIAIRRTRFAHPRVAIAVGGLALLALDPLLTSLSVELLAVLTALLLLCLQGVRTGRRWAGPALLLLLVVWANAQSEAVPVVLLLLVVLLGALMDRRRGRVQAAPALWLLPAVLLAVCINPRGPLIFTQLPLGLGQGGEYPLLAGWSSPNFHPFAARLAEVVGFLLILGYTVAGPRLRRQDTCLGLLTALMSLLWIVYLPLFLMVAAVQAAEYLSVWATHGPDRTGAHPRAPAWTLALAVLPVLLGLALVLHTGLQAERAGGPSQQLSRQLPVAAAGWLLAHPSLGTWYTTPGYGDYLATRAPSSGRLVCTTDPVSTGAARLGECEQLAVLNHGALRVIRQIQAGLAVLPPAAPEVAFLRAEGWRIRYRDHAALVLAPSNS